MLPDDLNDDDLIDRDPLCQHAFEEAWEELQAGSISGNPFNFLQLATVSARGRPEVRTIVLRQADRAEPALYFVTDVRSPKIEDISGERKVALVGYDPASRVQIRVTGTAATVSDRDQLVLQWNRLSEKTRNSFNAPIAPGARLRSDGGTPPDVEQDEMSAFKRFCLVRIELATLERLDISQIEHVRFCFVRSDKGWLGGRRAP